MPNLNTPEYVREALRESVNVDVPVEVIAGVMRDNAYLIIMSPNRENLYAGQANLWLVAPNYEEMRRMVEGRTWNNATAVSGRVLRNDF